MDAEQLHTLLPEFAHSDVEYATSLPAVQAAMKDLRFALAELTRCAPGTKSKQDWELTKEELLTEIRRLTQKACQRS